MTDSQSKGPTKGHLALMKRIGAERGARADLARKLGVLPSVVTKWFTEGEWRVPELQTLLAIQEHYKIRVPSWTEPGEVRHEK